MYRVFEITDSFNKEPHVVCYDKEGQHRSNGGYYFSNHPIDILTNMVTYSNIEELLADVDTFRLYFVSFDLGVQHKALNGEWYAYDDNHQLEHVKDVIELK